ncbi:MAG: glycosyltransferase [Chitinophagales bacterium]|nr:glycosyltransferase [Chitinophagales bacterium]MDW8274464.1 glycosyltransferase [Chitinophagales bacterium]
MIFASAMYAEEILFLIVLGFNLVYLAVVLYFLIHWLKIKKFQPKSANYDMSVSVVVPVRNEEKHIKECIESLLNQNYAKDLYEVIVVDDYSVDNTRKIIREINHAGLRFFDLRNYLGERGEKKPNKKEAISIGIKNAQGNIIITTDGDCVRGENWLRTMISFFSTQTYKLITAPVLIKSTYSPISILQQADVMALMGITAASIKAGKPIMCNGANLMYAKDTFVELEGFKGNHDVASGDDIFLMQKVLQRYPNSVGFVKNIDTAVFTHPESSFFSLINQRIRWVGKSIRFGGPMVRFQLIFFYLYNLTIATASIYSLYQYITQRELKYLTLLTVALGSKILIDLIFCLPVFSFFKKGWLVVLLPLIEPFHILYILLTGVLSLFGRYRWRGRFVKR